MGGPLARMDGEGTFYTAGRGIAGDGRGCVLGRPLIRGTGPFPKAGLNDTIDYRFIFKIFRAKGVLRWVCLG
jgi:hypothetical protein